MTEPSAASTLSASPPPEATSSSFAAAPQTPEPLTPQERQRILRQLDDIFDRLDVVEATGQSLPQASEGDARSVHNHPHLARSAAAPRLVAVDGLIGVGKTTLCKDLIGSLREQQAEGEHRLVVEPVLNEALNMFYANPDDMAERFQLLQCCLCTSSARLAVIESGYAERSGTVLLDRSPLGNLSFALVHYLAGRISEAGFTLYKVALSSNAPLCLPTTIHLHASPEIADHRITCRMRETDPTRVCESGIPIEYLQRLDAVMLLVSAYAAARGRSRVHFVDWTRFGSTAQVLGRLSESGAGAKVDLEALRAVQTQSGLLGLLGLGRRQDVCGELSVEVIRPGNKKRVTYDEDVCRVTVKVSAGM